LATKQEQLFQSLSQELKDDQKATLDKLITEVEQLSRRLSVLERDVASRPLPGALARGSDLSALKTALERELLSLSQRVQQPRGSAFALLGLGLVQLRQAATTGAPFKEELTNLSRLLPSNAIVKQLRSYESGVKSRAWLEEEYKRAAAQARRGGLLGSGSSPLLSFFSRLVSIRPVGELSGKDEAALLSQLTARLEEGDWTAALLLEEGIKDYPSAYAPLSPWFKSARARHRLDGLMIRLDQVVYDLLSRNIKQGQEPKRPQKGGR
jgi:hypothetical protein